MILNLATTPPLSFYRDRSDLALCTGLPERRLVTAGTMRRPLGGSVGSAEAGNLTVTLNNADGALTALFATPPIRVAATLDGPPDFSGIVTGVVMGPTVTLEMQAGNRLPLSDLVPLRRTTVWGSYRTDAAIPICYGTVTVAPVAYDAENTAFVAADHPCLSVIEVFRDNVSETAWSWRNEADSTGTTVCLVRLNEPLQSNERLTVRLSGVRDPATGTLITNPADVAWDFLTRCGIPQTRADLDSFRASCAALGLSVARVIDDGRQTVRTVLDDLFQSIGAVWSGGMTGLAKIYP